MEIKNYIRIARPDHWFKNIFILPGTIVALILTNIPIDQIILPFILGMISVCLIASANYVINEWVDAEYDKYHPLKKNRPSVVGSVKASIVYAEYIILAVFGLGISLLISKSFFVISILFLIMGVIYNIRPFRTKNRIYLDVLSESFNNPIRLTLGWFIVTSSPLPPSSLLFGYWMGGAFLMNVKRYAEFRFIGDKNTAGLYRRSFQKYTEERLLMASLFYGMCSAFFLGIFLVKYRIEFLFSFPFVALLFAWYFRIGMSKNSVAQNPEKLFLERKFVIYFILLILVFNILLFFDLPWLNWLLKNAFISE